MSKNSQKDSTAERVAKIRKKATSNALLCHFLITERLPTANAPPDLMEGLKAPAEVIAKAAVVMRTMVESAEKIAANGQDSQAVTEILDSLEKAVDMFSRFLTESAPALVDIVKGYVDLIETEVEAMEKVRWYDPTLRDRCGRILVEAIPALANAAEINSENSKKIMDSMRKKFPIDD